MPCARRSLFNFIHNKRKCAVLNIYTTCSALSKQTSKHFISVCMCVSGLAILCVALKKFIRLIIIDNFGVSAFDVRLSVCLKMVLCFKQYYFMYRVDCSRACFEWKKVYEPLQQLKIQNGFFSIHKRRKIGGKTKSGIQYKKNEYKISAGNVL